MKAKGTSKRSAGSNHRKAEREGAAREHYQREKERRAQRGQVDSPAMAAARREYLALLEADAAKGRGGRPRKQRAAKTDDESVEDAEAESAEE